MKKSKFRRVIIYVLLVAIILFSSLYLINYRYNKGKDIQLVNKIQLEIQEGKQRTKLNTIMEENKKEDENNVERQILPEYEELYNENNDMFGRIFIPGIEIETIEGTQKFDFPVMYTPEDPNFYEDKNWNKELCKVGMSIWIDGRTTEDTENIIIYGHNMKNLTMFGSLRYYKDKEFYKTHRYIGFDTLYDRQKYEIISVSKSIVYYDTEPPEGEYLFYEHIELDTKEEFDEYVKNVKENSHYDIEETAEFGDQLITLCTCDYEVPNERLIIVAKKI